MSGHSYEVRGGQPVRVGAPPRNLPADLQQFIDQPPWTLEMDGRGRPVVDDRGELTTRPAM
ncbi:MAG TPA: hypothetical protein VGD55_12275 [Acidothermaceae bacterium]